MPSPTGNSFVIPSAKVSILTAPTTCDDGLAPEIFAPSLKSLFAASPVAMAAAPAAGGEAAEEEQDSFTVVLTAVGEKKINVIKEVRTITGLGLKEAKDLVEGAPKDVKENASKEEAAEIKEKLEAAGATVDLK